MKAYQFSLQYGRNVTQDSLGPSFPHLVACRRFDAVGVPFDAAKDGCVRALVREVQNHAEGSPERILITEKIARVRQLDEPTHLADLEGFVL